MIEYTGDIWRTCVGCDMAKGFKAAWDTMANAAHALAQDKGWWDEVLEEPGCPSAGGKHAYAPVASGALRLACSHCGEELSDLMSFALLWRRAIARNKGELLALVHSELSEALEALRRGNPPDSEVPSHTNVEVELADTLIRIADMARAYGWDVAGALEEKMAYNKSRARRHGKAF
jgi:NTP pyrophosphatase (non-canonical NTP hydrolase)